MELVPGAVLISAAFAFCGAALEWGPSGTPVGFVLLVVGWMLAMELDHRLGR